MISASEFLKWLYVFKIPFGAAVGTFTVNAGTGLSGGGTASIGGSVTLNATGLTTAWVEVSSTTQAMAVNTEYASNNVSLVTFTLPATANAGDVISVYGKGDGGWRISQNSGQQILVGNSQSTVGVSGNISSTFKYDIVNLRCITGGANSLWTASVLSGNLSVL